MIVEFPGVPPLRFPRHTPLASLALLSSPKGAFVLRPRLRERPWVPACAGMTVALGNDGVVLEGDFGFGFDFVGVDFVAEAGLVGDC